MLIAINIRPNKDIQGIVVENEEITLEIFLCLALNALFGTITYKYRGVQ